MDCNNFYVSCERLFRPELKNKPVIVLSNNDGCVISRSNEVKALGIPMGAPLFQIQKLLGEHQTTIFSSNFALYGDISARVMDVVNSLVPQVEVYSIDEAFISFSGIKDIAKVAQHVSDQILHCVGIPTCIGIAPTKTLAKIANHKAKTEPSRNGVCVLEREEEIDAALQELEVGELWGVGKRISMRLASYGIKTAYDLKKINPRWMRQHFTVVGERIVYELNGVVCLGVEPEIKPCQSIQVSRSFSKKITEYEGLRQAVATYASRLAEKLRHYKLKTNNIVVSVCTNRFQVRTRKYYNSILINLPIAINDDSGLIKASIQGLESIFKDGYEYHKAGIVALDLMPISKTQLNLFDNGGKEPLKTQQISQALDKINKKYGRGTAHMASCIPSLSWKDRKTKKSPSYTTSWSELPKVFAK